MHFKNKRAIAELLKEMNEYKEKEIIPKERKTNPLGKPNKNFLGRTINSIMAHNKRQSDRNLQNCERKLRELDNKKRKFKSRKHQKEYDVICSHTYNERYKKRRMKKKRKKIRACRSSSTSSISSNINSPVQSKNICFSKERPTSVKDERCEQDFFHDSPLEYYVDPHMAYAVMAYNQMNHMMRQQQLVQQQIVNKELEETLKIPSDLSLSCHSSPESSLNISIHSSSAEEDENGIFTFKLSSDDDENEHLESNEKSSEVSNAVISIDCDEYDKDSVYSHISLESKDSQRSPLKETNEVYSLTSSCSDSEDICINS